MVCLTTLSAEREVKFPFSLKEQRNKSSWGGCTSCVLRIQPADLESGLSSCVWKCVLRMCDNPLPGLRYARSTGRRELPELEGLRYWQGLSLLPSQLQAQVPPSCEHRLVVSMLVK